MRGRSGAVVVGLLLMAGCGSGSSIATGGASPAAPSPSPTTVACADGRVTLAVAQTLTLQCGAAMELRLTGAALRQTAPDAFRAVAAGTASILLTGAPVCATGAVCPQFRIAAGVITVTVV